LKSAFESEIVPRSRLNFGQVYTSLERLEREGLVAHRVVSQEERPDKKVFSLTESGERALVAWLALPSPLSLDLRNETLLKLAIARRIPQGDPLAVIAVERRHALARLAELSEGSLKASGEGGSLELELLLELAALRLEAFLRWLERCEEAMRDGARKRDGGTRGAKGGHGDPR
jgi:DNA-binding PadR family transcriptional regulator